MEKQGWNFHEFRQWPLSKAYSMPGNWPWAQWLHYEIAKIYCLTQVEYTIVLKMKIIIILLNIQRRQDLKWKRP
jgi:hypothetical protein